jgi:uncharacterized membrane protein
MLELKSAMLYFLSIFFILSGLNHFLNPAFYVKITPPYVPRPIAINYISGLAEIILGGLLLVPEMSHIAAWGLILLLLAVFPANVHMAINSHLFPEFKPIYLWIRLPIQALFIAWAYWFT